MSKCIICNEEVDEACPDGACKICHYVATWNECMHTGNWTEIEKTETPPNIKPDNTIFFGN